MTMDAYQYAARLLLVRPHAEQDLAVKMRRKGFEASAIAAAIQQLRQEKHLDDARLVREVIEWHITYRPYGRQGLRARLARKGFTSSDINVALSERLTPTREREVCLFLARKRAARTPDRDKLARFLLARGFAQDAVIDALDAVTSQAVDIDS
jgi:SOS response regulatory protein OraA/RecX